MAAMDAMESELDRKSEYIRQLSAHVNLLEKQLEEKTLDNLAMRSLLQSYEQQGNNDHKNSKHSKLVGMDSVISTEEANYDLNTKIESYLNGLAKGQQCSNGLVLSTINSFMTLYHLNYSKRDINEDLVHEFFTNRTISRTTNSDNINELLTISLTYALLFLTQLQNRRLTDSLANKVTVESYPMHWLISMFPYVLSSDGNSDDNSEIKIDSWLPIHLAIGVDIDGSMLSRNKERYMDNLDRLLIEFGASAFTDEDVSPLSIAVAKQRPSIDVVKKLVSYCNDKLSIDIIRKTDFDGSLPLMHACANNKNTVIVDFLLSKYSQGLLILDNYGCSALHYACYSGYEAVVSYILMKSPESAHIVDSNGALPLHDAVQNITDKIRRTHNRSNSDSNTNTNNDSYSDYEDNEDIDNLDNSDTRKSASSDGNWNELSIVKMLLSANPQAVFHKDSFGAYPLHKAAKAASLNVVKLIYDAFPQAIYAADQEGLLPMHYYSQRSATNKELAVVDFLLASNPQSKVYDEKAIMNMYKQSQGTSGGFLSMFGMKSTTPKTNSVHPPNDTGNKSNNSNTDSPPVKSRGISFADEDIQDSQTDSTKARPKTRRRMTAKPVQRRSIHG